MIQLEDLLLKGFKPQHTPPDEYTIQTATVPVDSKEPQKSAVDVFDTLEDILAEVRSLRESHIFPQATTAMVAEYPTPVLSPLEYIERVQNPISFVDTQAIEDYNNHYLTENASIAALLAEDIIVISDSVEYFYKEQKREYFDIPQYADYVSILNTSLQETINEIKYTDGYTSDGITIKMEDILNDDLFGGVELIDFLFSNFTTSEQRADVAAKVASVQKRLRMLRKILILARVGYLLDISKFRGKILSMLLEPVQTANKQMRARFLAKIHATLFNPINKVLRGLFEGSGQENNPVVGQLKKKINDSFEKEWEKHTREFDNLTLSQLEQHQAIQKKQSLLRECKQVDEYVQIIDMTIKMLDFMLKDNDPITFGKKMLSATIWPAIDQLNQANEDAGEKQA